MGLEPIDLIKRSVMQHGCVTLMQPSSSASNYSCMGQYCFSRLLVASFPHELLILTTRLVVPQTNNV